MANATPSVLKADDNFNNKHKKKRIQKLITATKPNEGKYRLKQNSYMLFLYFRVCLSYN